MPGRTPAAWNWFMAELVALEPRTENSGNYTFKPGYHASRADNEATWPTNYSVRDAVDKLGPDDCSAAGDWTHLAAQQGDYASMDRYGERLESAFTTHDPRLAGWREALGQTDLDATPEGLDFRYWTRRTPDSTHAWHWHFSESRAYSESYDNKRALLSVLRGESLDEYLATGGVLLGKDGSGVIGMEQRDKLLFPTTNNPDRQIGNVFTDLSDRRDWEHAVPGTASHNAPPANSRLALLHKRVEDMAIAISKLTVPTPAPVDPAALKAVLLDPEVLAALAKAVVDEEHARLAD